MFTWRNVNLHQTTLVICQEMTYVIQMDIETNWKKFKSNPYATVSKKCFQKLLLPTPYWIYQQINHFYLLFLSNFQWMRLTSESSRCKRFFKILIRKNPKNLLVWMETYATKLAPIISNPHKISYESNISPNSWKTARVGSDSKFLSTNTNKSKILC